MGTLNSEYSVHVFDLAPQYNLDPLLIFAMIEVESAGNRFTSRFEPDWHYFIHIDEWARNMAPPHTAQTEKMLQQMSWGLMQVMGSVARELGHATCIPELTNPRLGILFGLRQFTRVHRPGYTVEENIAAYNAGSARRLPNGLFENQSYVDKVMAAWARYKATAGAAHAV